MPRSRASSDPSVRRRLSALHARIQFLKADLSGNRRTVLELLDELEAATARFDEILCNLEPVFVQSRQSQLATRFAAHFFVEKSMSRFCERVLDELIKEVGAGSGAVVLFRGEPPEAQLVASRDHLRQSIPPERLRLSRTILSKIIEGEDSVLVEDALSDLQLGGEESVQRLHLRSVLAIPLRFQEYLAGAVYLENESSAGAFGEDDRELLLAAGRLIAIYLNAAFRLREEVRARRRIYDEVKGKTHFDGIVGSSPLLLEVLERVAQVGPSDAPVVIDGESGTGKELIARALHLSSRRAKKPVVVVNCAALPENLLESELFGHEKGAFTGAFERKIGRFEEANGATLFLDEIAEMPLPLQAKLLRFLQNGELQRLGSTRTIHIDVRLIAATNRDMRALVKRGEFREDLFFRLYVVPITVPPLRKRAEDVVALIDHFCRVFALRDGKEPPQIDAEVYGCLQQYQWPGNVRELENLIQRLVVLSKDNRIRAEDLPEYLRPAEEATLDIQKNPFQRFMAPTPVTYQELKNRRNMMHRLATTYAQKLEDRFVDAILERAGGNISRAAQLTGVHRTIIHRNLKSRKAPRDA